MKITETRVSIPKTEMKNIAAFVGITLDDCFAIHGIKVIKSDKGLFVVMPSTKTKDGFKDVCHPINKETREKISEAVLEAYEKALKEVE